MDLTMSLLSQAPNMPPTTFLQDLHVTNQIVTWHRDKFYRMDDRGRALNLTLFGRRSDSQVTSTKQFPRLTRSVVLPLDDLVEQAITKAQDGVQQECRGSCSLCRFQG